jgi:hypothetical protein
MLTAWRGETRLLELPFEVGASPLTVSIPSVADPSGFTWERRRAADTDATSPTIAPKIQGDPIGIVCYGRIVGGKDRGLRDAGVNFITNHDAWRGSQARDDCFAVAGLGAGRTGACLYSPKGRLPFTDWVDIASAPPGAATSASSRGRRCRSCSRRGDGKALGSSSRFALTPYEIPHFSVIATKEPPPPCVPVVDPDWNYFRRVRRGPLPMEDPNNH